jgi:hypothetical protein
MFRKHAEGVGRHSRKATHWIERLEWHHAKGRHSQSPYRWHRSNRAETWYSDRPGHGGLRNEHRWFFAVLP